MSRLQDGPFQDKTVNELKLRFVKTWWVRWPSFVSLPPINFLCHTSWVKYREAWKWQSSTQTQISSEFSWLGRRSCHKHAGPPPRTLTHILSSSLFTYAHYCLTLRASTQPIGCFFLTAERPSSNHTLSRSQIPVWICPDKNAPQEGDCASVSAGLFWGTPLWS